MGLSGWPEANMFAQPDLERALDARARGLASVTVHRGHEVVGLEAGSDDVAVTVARHDGARALVRAPFVVGCDGANSFVSSAGRQHRHRPRVLLRLAHRRPDPARAAGVEAAQLAALRPGPADDDRVRRAGAPALGVHAPSG
jgi:2-polyprenyl-6-methoxyphenol hydroxylase-like FAD-dependent oxidoreductase